MDKINVYWLSYHQPEILARGYWDQGQLEDIFAEENYNHTIGIPGTVKGGGVVIINGRTHINDTEKINADIARLDWVLFIETGDEEASFPWREVKHKLMKVWIQMPRMNQHDDVSFHLPNGYRPETSKIFEGEPFLPKTIDYFFAGQVNHERRQQCADVLNQFKTVYPTAIVIESDAFGKEILPYAEYLLALAQTKIAPCPSGVESPDTFRLYEALEAGCLPVVDAFSTKNKSPGFWHYLFKEDPPFPIVDYWDKFPQILPQLLKEYPANVNKVSAWWQQQKRNIKFKLIDDIKELSR